MRTSYAMSRAALLATVTVALRPAGPGRRPTRLRDAGPYRAQTAATALRATVSPADVMYQAQKAAMEADADAEGACFDRESVIALVAPSLEAAAKPKKKAKRGKGKAGGGFASGKTAPVLVETPAACDAAARWRTLKKEGILKIEGACAPATAADLRAYVVRDVENARAACAASDEPAFESMRRFHAIEEQPLRSFLLTPLDDVACHAGLRELFGADAALGDVFEKACGGDDAWFYDYNALRTEPGSRRQPVHWRGRRAEGQRGRRRRDDDDDVRARRRPGRVDGETTDEGASTRRRDDDDGETTRAAVRCGPAFAVSPLHRRRRPQGHALPGIAAALHGLRRVAARDARDGRDALPAADAHADGAAARVRWRPERQGSHALRG